MGRWAGCDRVDRAAFQRLRLVQGPGGQEDGVAGADDALAAVPHEIQPAADDHQYFIDRMGVKAMHLARGVVLQLDRTLLRQQAEDRRINGKFGSLASNDLGHAACSLSSRLGVLVCASLAKGQPPPVWLSSCRKYC